MRLRRLFKKTVFIAEAEALKGSRFVNIQTIIIIGSSFIIDTEGKPMEKSTEVLMQYIVTGGGKNFDRSVAFTMAPTLFDELQAWPTTRLNKIWTTG